MDVEHQNQGLLERYRSVQNAVCECAATVRHDADAVRLIAVSKTFPAADIRNLYAAGQRDFGENYIQEWAGKLDELADLDIVWHIIGQVQSNKSRIVAEHAAWLHTVDRLKLARRLSEQRPDNLPPLNVCIEVNTSGSSDKHGVAQGEVAALALEIAAFPNLRLRGLMCVPSAHDVERLNTEFALMGDLLRDLQQRGLAVDVLSMGMSGDMPQAIAAGATHVRIGSAIFGKRDYPA